jgi:putative glycosyltransferase (TIGR04372 family)
LKFLKKYIIEFRGQVIRKLRNFGLIVRRAQNIDIEIGKLQSIKDLNARLRYAEKLVSMFPKNPKAHLELVRCLHTLSDSRVFEQMNRYAAIMEDWLIDTGLGELNIEFIWSGMVTGSFGNLFAVEGLLRANKYHLRPVKKLFLLLPENTKPRNSILFSYFEPYINVIRDRETIQNLRDLESSLTLPLGIGLPMNNICPFLDISANMSEVERIKIGMDAPLLFLDERHRDRGMKELKNLGIPDDAWYVTLHIREPTYRGETKENTKENFRNANPLDYLRACETITKAGGWVFRMGDPSMTPLPEMPQVFDYAHMEMRSEFMDVFLGATCRFLIGTASGFIDLPRYFGVPRIFTNCTRSVDYFNMVENDLYLPRLLKYQKNDKYLSFEEYMSPPVSMYVRDKKILEEGLAWVVNTPKEIEEATIEMLERTNNEKSLVADDDLQQRFKTMAEKCGQKHGGHMVKAFAPVSREFLHKHVDLLK